MIQDPTIEDLVRRPPWEEEDPAQEVTVEELEGFGNPDLTSEEAVSLRTDTVSRQEVWRQRKFGAMLELRDRVNALAAEVHALFRRKMRDACLDALRESLYDDARLRMGEMRRMIQAIDHRRPTDPTYAMGELEIYEATKPFVVAVGAALRTLRIQRGLHAKDLAARMGVTTMALTHHETGRRAMRVSHLQMYADHLGLRPEDILDLASRIMYMDTERVA